MKRNVIFFAMSGLLLAGSFFYSCTKEKDLIKDMDQSEYANLDWVRKPFTGELTPKEQLGKNIYFDRISSPGGMACADCHAPRSGFTGPIAAINLKGAVYPGADGRSFGNRKPPSAAYASFSPVFYYDAGEGLFIGGNFWDGRATGLTLGSPTAEQAQGPFLNPVEHGLETKEDVLKIISKARYADMWAEVWGEPISFDNQAEIDLNYDRLGLTIAAFEASEEVNQFSSKYDYYLKGLVDLSEEEALGLVLFNDPDKGNCAACHPSEGEGALFTDFSFDNLGTPKNPMNPFYDTDPNFIDPGLGGFLQNSGNPAWVAMAAENMGKHKVPTLRNVDKRPGPNFAKAFMHNGVLKSLEEVVHFYNTRDVEDWPAPEVTANVNTDELGDLGLTMEEEKAIVAFMKTLSDGYRLK